MTPAQRLKLPKKPQTRMWRAGLIRAKLERLGIVYGPDRQSAEAAAVEQFRLT